MTAKPVYFTGQYVIPAAAGGVNGNVLLSVNARFVRCLSSSTAGTPFLMQLDDAPLAQMDQGLAAFCAPGDNFQKISLQNATGAPITVTIAYGQGDLTDARLSVSGVISENLTEVGGNAVVTGTGASGAGVQRVTVANDSFATGAGASAGSPRVVVANDSGANPLPNGKQLNMAGASFYTNGALAAGTAYQIVAPASNVNGVIARRATLRNSASNGVHLTTGAAAPTSQTSNPAILSHWTGNDQAQLDRDIFIPAGQGLWVWVDPSAAGLATVNYDLL